MVFAELLSEKMINEELNHREHAEALKRWVLGGSNTKTFTRSSALD